MLLTRFLSLSLSLLGLAHAHPATEPRNTGNEDIVGGEFAEIYDYPYMGAIHYKGEFHCGGTLISPTKVLSAAHCFYKFGGPSAFNIRFGSDDRESGGMVVDVAGFAINPDYDPNNFNNDIAVVTLAKPVYTLKPAVLSTTFYPAFNGGVTLVGWGLLATDGYSPLLLRKVDVEILPDSDCRNVYGPTTFAYTNLCVGVPGGGKGSCQGDSGGPAIQGNDTVVGVTSYGGLVCASKDYPSVYVNVADYSSFINSHL